MESIRNYLDNVFASVPNTEAVARVKAELLANMEDKYRELIEGGASENEAAGRVFTDFGNIDELFAELGIAHGAGENTIGQGDMPVVSTVADTKPGRWKRSLLCFLSIFLLVTILTAIYVGNRTNIYRSDALIIIEVNPEGEFSSFDWIDLIRSRLTSRIFLQRVIKEFHMFDYGIKSSFIMEDAVLAVRRQIIITSASQKIIRISFRAADPLIARKRPANPY